ncbi:hypothetical protein [Gorillibacterium sp. CAU 1737]|uniref:hypothetical protein n=1 Tax=Gorillibacterium sp. CAU 1737 TaxID=3140362 RepID=UPI0032601CC9
MISGKKEQISNNLELWERDGVEVELKEWQGRDALYLEGIHKAIFLREAISYPAYRFTAEVAIPGDVAFAGLVFGAQDSDNYELVYLAPYEIQYDPIQNGSMTWQIHNGPAYQKPLPNTTGVWQTLTVEVQPGGARVFFGEDAQEAALTLPNLQHGGKPGKVGLWSYLPCYFRNLVIEEIPQQQLLPSQEVGLAGLQAESFVTEWQVSAPYQGESVEPQEWNKAFVNEDGTLNLNRLYRAEKGAVVQLSSGVELEEERESVLTLGYSDAIRLWVNEEEVYSGSWRWNPPHSDGRVRPTHASVPIRWKKGHNSIRAELTHEEPFGWGLAVRTGLN